MTTLVDSQIHQWAANGGVEPFNPDRVNPASINLALGHVLKVESPRGDFYDVDLSDVSQARPFTVDPGEFVLAHTAEVITIPENMLGKVHLRSSAARAGWDHLLAGFVDPGWSGRLTLEFKNNLRYAVLPLYPGLQLVQLELCRLERAPKNHYGVTGRYFGDQGVRGCQDASIRGI